MTRREQPRLVIANWKMNVLEADALALLPRYIAAATQLQGKVQTALAPSYPALSAVGRVLSGSSLWLAAQDVHWDDRGAFTGAVSPAMLHELGVQLVLVGHSERRHLFGEADEWVGRKTAACLRHGLLPVVCVGETERERDEGRTAAVIARQLAAVFAEIPAGLAGEIVVAYEPVWAIGTGRTATAVQIALAHHVIAERLAEHASGGRLRVGRILYGGSVTPEIAPAIFAVREVDGALVGNASLDPERFFSISAAAAC